jgi:antitoxin component of RelBE/YafQ-DinJ toxin-antitoxin module
MVLKTFNVDEKVYGKFSKFCKGHGISMSKQVELFMEAQMEDKEVKPAYLKKLDKIRKGKYHKFNTVAELRRIIEE